MSEKIIPLHKVFMSEDVLEPVCRTLMSGYIGQGPQVAAFEKIVGQYLGNERVAAINCATSGIHLLLRLIGERTAWSKDEILTIPLTCFSYYTRVNLGDGRTMAIGDIVEKRLPIEVLSFNEKTSCFERKKVNGWVKTPLGISDWYRIRQAHGCRSNSCHGGYRGAWITGDHKLLTKRGYICVNCLQPNDLVLTTQSRPNNKQLEVLRGSMLGDGSITLRKKSSCRYVLAHSANQSEWFNIETLSLMGMKHRIDHVNARGQTGPSLVCEADSCNFWRELRKEWYSSRGKKIIPKNLELTPLMLATWYMDDGSLTGNTATFCTECFDLESFWTLFWKVAAVGFRCHAQKHGEGFRLIITNAEDGESATKFFQMIAKYIPPSMRYKLPPIDLSQYESAQWDLAGADTEYVSVIVERADPPRWERPKYAYCLQVADNHNFVVLDLVVSNCLATNMPILANGLKPRWVDVDDNLCMNLDDLRRKLSPRTAGILVVHWGGVPCQIHRINDAAQECFDLYGYRPPIIEDCAHAFGTTYDTKHLGNHGNLCVFSFGAIKNLTTGDGGAIVSPDSEWHDRIKKLRWYGLDRESQKPHNQQEVNEWGYKFQMNDIAATIGIHNFSHIPGLIAKQRDNADYYRTNLRSTPDIRSFVGAGGMTSDPSWWLFTMMVRRRNDFIKKMWERGVEVGIVHSRNDLHPCFRKYRVPLPSLDFVSDNMVCLYGESPVLLANGSSMAIREIVNLRKQVEVMSYNLTTSKFEPKLITGWHKNNLGDRKWVRLIGQHFGESGGNFSKKIGIWMTEDHPVLTKSGYKQAREISVDDLLHTNTPALNTKQHQFVIGTLLGDASICDRFSVGHKFDHLDYLQCKEISLNGFRFSWVYSKGNGKSKPSWTLRCGWCPQWKKMQRRFYHAKKKIIPTDLSAEELGEISLAAWFIDDGSVQGNVITLHSQSFTKEDNERLSKLLSDRFGVIAHVVPVRHQYQIKIGNGRKRHWSAERLFDIVSPYIPPSYRYKIKGKGRKFNRSLWDLGKADLFFESAEVQYGSPRLDYTVKTVYCLDIADNHNFVVNNLVCHNCIPNGWWLNAQEREYIIESIKKGW